jgi:hypothetical protein
MAEKPRVKAPSQRSAPRTASEGPDRRLLYLVGGLGVLLVAVVVVVALVGFGGGKDARAALTAAGCTLEDFPAVSRNHTNNPELRSDKWNSFPPTSGEHFVTPAVYGFYSEPLDLARVLHGLEHGGVYMLYGPRTPADTPEKLRAIYDRDPRGLVVAPLPGLGDEIALGAWTSENVSDSDLGTGHLAKCTEVDEEAVDAFLDAYRGRGPERAPLDALQPGST